MSNKTEKAIDSLINGLVQYVDNKINTIPYVKTDIGKIKAVSFIDGKYIHTVTVRNYDYTGIKSLGNNEFTADSVVYILVPNGQYNNMFILGHLDDTNANIKGGSINLGNGKFVVDNDGNMTATSGKIGLFTIDEGFKYYESTGQEVLGKIMPSSAGGFGGIEISGQSVSIGATREITIGDDELSSIGIYGRNINLGDATTTTTEVNGSFNVYSYNPLQPTGLELDFSIPEQINMVSYTWSRYPMYAPSFVQGSDKNIKKNIKELDKDKASKFILNLKPCEYKLKDENIDKQKHHGFIAQEVKESMYDDWGVYVDGETKGMSYVELIADMIATIQKQQEQIENMKKEITKMKKDITKLGKEE